jgi:Zn-dependent peptidase ImmA (M78 family)
MGTRRGPEILELRETGNSREERYANVFARTLLTPASSVKLKFQEILAGAERLTRRHVVVLAHFLAYLMKRWLGGSKSLVLYARVLGSGLKQMVVFPMRS